MQDPTYEGKAPCHYCQNTGIHESSLDFYSPCPFCGRDKTEHGHVHIKVQGMTNEQVQTKLDEADPEKRFHD